MVLSASTPSSNVCLALNRPLAKSINEQLATLVLNGADSSAPPRYGKETIAKFLEAFGPKAAIYLGGPKMQEQPAVLVHGFEEIEGSEEIAPGTKSSRVGKR